MINAIKTVNIMTSKYCNLDCLYCTWKHTQHLSEYVKIEEEINNDKDNFFFFIGTNEPFLNLNYLEDIITLAINKKNVVDKIGVYTNGTIDNEQVFNLLHKYRNNIELIVSLDGTQEYHDLYRVDHSGNGTYNKVINFINKYNFIVNEIAVTTCPSYDIVKCLKHILEVCVKNDIFNILVTPVISNKFFSKFKWSKRRLIEYYQILDQFEQYINCVSPNLKLIRSCSYCFDEIIIINKNNKIKRSNIFE
ncbi:MAG: radical SAM protein [Elusimicrobiota bacterium]|jgi:sulfatase maturation enzyme AslB (radical SAM superfamily)|nr:radical SAM protein [Elusimicrobiota bacterium]